MMHLKSRSDSTVIVLASAAYEVLPQAILPALLRIGKVLKLQADVAQN